MEYLWYIIAAIGAGVGTGLAGLSAATVMVPILIVLCPSFAGEAGAYQATAIALASDILGSAVTCIVYFRHGNIDLKRAWLMMVCILTMCVAGSFVAWQVGNTVLGGFSLFLTFAIGIRFLIKPDTQRDDTVDAATRLDIKGILVSLFFGLTIGFGAGFVGTGGGMMMLIVFTVFLGMNLKAAVGTSTFIMTFTALIATVSHVMINPEMLFSRADAFVICITTATVASLISARFANRVSNHTVGLTTGAVLTVLGAAMLVLRYENVIFAYQLAYDTLECSIKFAAYIAICVVILLVARFVFKPPQYIFRKLLHFVAFTSAIEMIYVAHSWQATVLALLAFSAVVYLILTNFESFTWYKDLFVEKKVGEIKASLLMLFCTVAVIVALSWGLMGLRWISYGALVMWGFGDAAASIVGIRYGQHRVMWRLADSHKTWEGSAAMCVVSFAVGLFCLALTSDLSVPVCLLLALICAPLGTWVELISKGGIDTATVPTALVIALCLLMRLLPPVNIW